MNSFQSFSRYFFGLSRYLTAFIFSIPLTQLLAQTASEAISIEAEYSIESITVTATREDSDILKTPVAVAAFEIEEQLDKRFERLSDVANQVSGTSVDNSGNSAFPIILIRGVGSTDTSMGSDASIGFYIDDVYIGRAMGVINDLFDIERVELIKGPQAPLWGRNTLGGAFHIITKPPADSDKSELNFSLGNFSNREVGGFFSKAFSEKLNAKLSFNRYKRDGYSLNILDGSRLGDSDLLSVRSSVSYQISNQAEWLLSVDFTRDRSSSAGFDPLITGQPISGGLLGDINVTDFPFNHIEPQDEFLVSHRLDTREHRDIYGFSGKYSQENDNYSFVSITSVRGIDFDNVENTDALSVQLIELFQESEQQQFSQELRLSGQAYDFDWTLGAYYFREDIEDQIRLESQDFNLLLSGLVGPQNYSATNNSDLTATSYALFGSLRYEFRNNLKVDLGLRYSSETKDYDFSRVSNDVFGVVLTPGIPQSRLKNSWDRFSPSITISYSPSQQHFYYASITTGFRSGGFNTLQTTLEEAFDEETLTAYQLGYKSQLINQKLIIDISAFHYDHKDLQVQTLLPQSTGTPTVVTSNAAKTTERGLDLSLFTKPIDSLTIDLSFSLLDASYDEFINARGINVAGNQVKFSSRYSGVLGLEYSQKLSDTYRARFRAEYSRRSRIFFTEANLNGLMQPSYSLFNSYIEFSSDESQWTTTIYGKNLANNAVIGSATDFLDILGTVTRVYKPPRTYGIQLKLKF